MRPRSLEPLARFYPQTIHSSFSVTAAPDSSCENMGLNPHLPPPSFILGFRGPPICAPNLSLVSPKCQCGGASVFSPAMDFPWNAPFFFFSPPRFTPRTSPVLIGGDYEVFIFPYWVWEPNLLVHYTIVRWVLPFPSEVVTHICWHTQRTNAHRQLDKVRFRRKCVISARVHAVSPPEVFC